MNRKVSFSVWYVLLAVMAVILVHDFLVALQKIEEIPYSEFKTLVGAGRIADVSLGSQLQGDRSGN